MRYAGLMALVDSLIEDTIWLSNCFSVGSK